MEPFNLFDSYFAGNVKVSKAEALVAGHYFKTLRFEVPSSTVCNSSL